jgi:hypothetical protein
VVGRARATTVRLQQRGEMRTAPDKPWMPVAAEQYFSSEPPGFVWRVDGTMMRVLPFAGRRSLTSAAWTHADQAGVLITVADGQGRRSIRARCCAYLGEIVWFPSRR